MSDFRNNELRRLDLTVLLVFIGLLRHRKATEVAAELAITQSAVSHALKRLREVFGDELFLRRPHGMEPTAVALALEAPIAAAIESLRRAIAGPQKFDPASAEGVIRLAALDAELVTLVPELIRTLSTSAPGMRIIARAIGRQNALDAITARELDIALGYFLDLGDAFIKDELFQEDFLVVGNRSRHRLAGRISLEAYLKHPHILVSPGGDLRGVVDDVLDSKSLTRRVIAALPLFLPALAAVQTTNALATVPRGIALKYARAFHLAVAEPPLTIRSFSIAAVRHRRDEHNPMHRWLLERLRQIPKKVRVS
jgi:DNA-binding transcriptional LysR family regulator